MHAANCHCCAHIYFLIGRTAMVRGISNGHLPNILNQAVLFGFDWVIYANTSYCRLSVIPDGKA